MPLPSPPRPDSRLRLPIGLHEKGRRLRDLELRSDEDLRVQRTAVDFLAPREQALSSAFAARIAALGPLRNPDAAIFHRLALADRHWLAASLLFREGTTALQVPASCRKCGQILELELSLAEALAKAEPILLRRGRKRSGMLRLPTAADLDVARTAEDLARLCAGSRAGTPAIEARLQQADPLCVVELNGRCCVCGSSVNARIDLAGLWLGSQQRLAEDFLHSVHTLAQAYHWSEREILSLPDPRRRAYLRLCRTETAEFGLEQHVYE